jgi:hypothetical protein
LQFGWKKINAAKDVIVIWQELPYRQSKIKEKEQESPLGTQMWNVIIATKRVICPKIAGLKEVARKVKDKRARKGQTEINQTRHKEQT